MSLVVRIIVSRDREKGTVAITLENYTKFLLGRYSITATLRTRLVW